MWEKSCHFTLVFWFRWPTGTRKTSWTCQFGFWFRLCVVVFATTISADICDMCATCVLVMVSTKVRSNVRNMSKRRTRS